MDISGKWHYSEDFGFGKSEGVAELLQSGKSVSGTFSFTEKVENDYEIKVTEKVAGTISAGKILLKSVDVLALQNGREIDYLPNSFLVHRVSENKLVGSTYDCDNVCGVFVLEKL